MYEKFGISVENSEDIFKLQLKSVRFFQHITIQKLSHMTNSRIEKITKYANTRDVQGVEVFHMV